MDTNELVEGGLGLGAFALKRRKPKEVSVQMPSFDELEQRIAEIHHGEPSEDLAVPSVEITVANPPSRELPPSYVESEGPAEGSQDVATACVPCSIGHWSTCSGLLNEAVRFKHEGMSDEVIDRVNSCLDELNALERIDLTAEKIQKAPAWERPIAEEAKDRSRELRHGLENVTTVEEVEALAAQAERFRKQLGRDWFKTKMENMAPDERESVMQRVQEKLSDAGGQT